MVRYGSLYLGFGSLLDWFVGFSDFICCVEVQISDFVRVDDEKFDAMQCGKFVDALACSISVYTHHRCLTIVFLHLRFGLMMRMLNPLVLEALGL